jgi:hypothetical protein
VVSETKRRVLRDGRVKETRRTHAARANDYATLASGLGLWVFCSGADARDRHGSRIHVAASVGLGRAARRLRLRVQHRARRGDFHRQQRRRAGEVSRSARRAHRPARRRSARTDRATRSGSKSSPSARSARVGPD